MDSRPIVYVGATAIVGTGNAAEFGSNPTLPTKGKKQMSIMKQEESFTARMVPDTHRAFLMDSKDIYGALAKSQLEFEAATKNASNPHLKSKYANLQAYLDEARPVLAKNGIAVVQTARTEKFDAVLYAGVRTVLVHSSGQSIDCGELMLPVATPNAQGIGSSLTYARRYALASCLALSADDDDGHAASNKAKRVEVPAPAPAPSGDVSLMDALTSSIDWTGELKMIKARMIGSENKGELQEAWADANTAIKNGMPKEWLAELAALKDRRKGEL